MKKLKGAPRINSGEEIAGLDPDAFSVFLIEFDKKNNVRLQYDERALKELAASIRSEGQLQPVGVGRKQNENAKHPLVYGYRRFIAVADILKSDRIRVVFVDGENRDLLQLTENIHRTDLSDIEIARSLVAIKERTGETNGELAKRLNKSEDWIKDKIFHAKTIDGLIQETGETVGENEQSGATPAKSVSDLPTGSRDIVSHAPAKKNVRTGNTKDATTPASTAETAKIQAKEAEIPASPILESDKVSEGVPAHLALEKLTTSHVRETRGLEEAERKAVLLDAALNNRGAKEVRSLAFDAKAKHTVTAMEKGEFTLSEKDQKRGEKLALRLQEMREMRARLEDKLIKVKAEEKRVLKELKSIGQPQLFGVEP